MHPYQKSPPVAWYDLWPSEKPSRKNPADGHPIPVWRLGIIPVLDGFTLAGNSKHSLDVRMTEIGWCYRLASISVTFDSDIYITISDNASGRIIVKDAPVIAFVGGEGGKQFANYTFQFGERQSLNFTFENVGGRSIVTDCCMIGRYYRGTL